MATGRLPIKNGSSTTKSRLSIMTGPAKVGYPPPLIKEVPSDEVEDVKRFLGKTPKDPKHTFIVSGQTHLSAAKKIIPRPLAPRSPDFSTLGERLKPETRKKMMDPYSLAQDVGRQLRASAASERVKLIESSGGSIGPKA